MLAPASILLSAATHLTQWRGCLHHRKATVDGYTFNYYEGGSGEPLVLLHGLADDKTSFLGSAAKMTGSYRVILPDLAGHGDNAQDPDRDYSVSGHVSSLHGFFAELGLSEFHLGGNSMGGQTSAAYTLRYPSQVKSLTLVNAPGAGTDTAKIYAGFGARMKTVEDFDAVLERVYYQKPKLPDFVKQHMLKEMDKRFDHVNAMTQAVRDGEDLNLADRIADIKQPTLVLWGKHDIVVPMDVAEAYATKIPNAQLRLLDNGAHSPQLEIPGPVADEITAFLRSLT